MESIDKPNLDGQEGPLTDVSNAANLDALSAPEGGYDSAIDGSSMLSSEESLLDSSNDTNGLPNLDPVNEEPTKTSEPVTASDPASVDEYWMEHFNKLKEEREGYEIPENLNKENYLDHLKDAWADNRNESTEIHPDLMKIQDALNNGYDIKKALNDLNHTFDVLNLADRDLLKLEIGENNKEWDNTKIDQVVEKLENAGMLELEAERVRNRVRAYNENKLNTMAETAKAEHAERVQQVNEERSNQITEALNVFEQMDNVYGLPISKAEKAEFKDYFSKLVTPDESGTAPMFQMLQSNENLVKLAAIMWKGDEKIRGAITDAKESGKNSFREKLDRNPKGFDSGGPLDPTKVDLEALSAPERLVI